MSEDGATHEYRGAAVPPPPSSEPPDRTTLGVKEPDALVRSDGPRPAEPGPDAVATRSAGPSSSLPALVGMGAAFLAVMGLQTFSAIVAPVFLALTLVITLHPIRTWVNRRGWPPWAGTLALIAVLYLLVLGMLAGVGVAVARFATVVPNYANQFADLYQTLLHQLARFGIGQDQVDTALSRIDPSSVIGVAQTLLTGIGGATTLTLLLLLGLVFLAMDGQKLPARVATIADERADVVNALSDFAHHVRRYWAVSTVFGLLLAFLDVVTLLVLDVPLAFTFGLLAFIANYVPNIGFLLALVPPAVLAYLDGGTTTFLAVVVAYIAINVVTQSLLLPKFAGDAVGLNTTVTFLSLAFWAVVMGPLGLLLAVPLTLFVKAIFVDRVPRARWLNAFLSHESDTA
jgi:AI-2 transport protein TqsA